MRTNRTLAPHYRWGTHCDGWHLLATPGLSVIEERMPPGTSEVRHSHQRSQQFFFVLAGTLTIEVGGVHHSLDVGDGLHVAASAPHQVFNRAAIDASFLVVSQPPSHGDRDPAPI
jgi:mannose-6-phosphate isomerase-like protein (cupin superfamily)